MACKLQEAEFLRTGVAFTTHLHQTEPPGWYPTAVCVCNPTYSPLVTDFGRGRENISVITVLFPFLLVSSVLRAISLWTETSPDKVGSK